jgi:hypothetical protein
MKMSVDGTARASVAGSIEMSIFTGPRGFPWNSTVKYAFAPASLIADARGETIIGGAPSMDWRAVPVVSTEHADNTNPNAVPTKTSRDISPPTGL